MQIPLEVTFRNVDHSEAVEARVRHLAAKLERYCDRITSCRVVVEQLHRHHQHGNHYHVRIDLTVPDQELVVAREPAAHHSHVDVFVALRDAFDAMRRQLQAYQARQQGVVKMHVAPPVGHVVELRPEADFGRLEAPDGHLVWFHRNSVKDGTFDDLTTGDEVRYSEETGERGPQASAVRPTGRRNMTGER